MNNDLLKSCNSCKHNINEMCAKTIITKYHEPTDTYYQETATCEDARLGECGIDAIHYEAVEVAKSCETCVWFMGTPQIDYCKRIVVADNSPSVQFERGAGGGCGISAIYHEPSEPSIEQLEVMFDGLEDEKPKSRIETREGF